MKTVLMIFVTEKVMPAIAATMKTYSYDTDEELQIGDVYATHSYSKNLLQVQAIEPKVEKVVPYTIKEIVVGTPPEIPVANSKYVYVKKVG